MKYCNGNVIFPDSLYFIFTENETVCYVLLLEYFYQTDNIQNIVAILLLVMVRQKGDFFIVLELQVNIFGELGPCKYTICWGHVERNPIQLKLINWCHII